MRYQFVDCRWALGDPGWGIERYLEGHIPGASFLDLERDLAAPAGDGSRGRHPLPSADAFAHAAGEAGIGPGTFVVAYGSLGGAERLWWLLRHFGHDDCAVIDLEDWRGPLHAGLEEIASLSFVPVERTGDTIETDELAARLEELVVVDARLPARYRGDENPIDKAPGRIPGSFNAPWNEQVPELPVGELVAYCGSGITACVPLHALHLQGLEGRLYPGSWSVWERRDDLPKATG
jgi:thiosulfate/3-mercaptopyruvate sulfurtransferase